MKCRACGLRPNLHRQATGMDICRTCEINEIRADMINRAPWWVEYEAATERAMFELLRQASIGVREGLQCPIPYGET